MRTSRSWSGARPSCRVMAARLAPPAVGLPQPQARACARSRRSPSTTRCPSAPLTRASVAARARTRRRAARSVKAAERVEGVGSSGVGVLGRPDDDEPLEDRLDRLRSTPAPCGRRSAASSGRGRRATASRVRAPSPSSPGEGLVDTCCTGPTRSSTERITSRGAAASRRRQIQCDPMRGQLLVPVGELGDQGGRRPLRPADARPRAARRPSPASHRSTRPAAASTLMVPGRGGPPRYSSHMALGSRRRRCVITMSAA